MTEKYKEIDSEIYTFIWGPSLGLLKKIENYKIVHDSKFYFVEKFEEEHSKRVEIKREERFAGEDKVPFIMKGILFPILGVFFFLILFLYGITERGDPLTVNIFGGLFALITMDAGMFFHRLREYKSGVSRFVEHDFKKVAALFLFLIIYGVIAVTKESLDIGALSIGVLLFFMYFIFIEGIKKPLLVLLSENIQYWRYIGNRRRGTFIAVTVKPLST